jgi:hypothetical protein
MQPTASKVSFTRRDKTATTLPSLPMVTVSVSRSQASAAEHYSHWLPSLHYTCGEVIMVTTPADIDFAVRQSAQQTPRPGRNV